jgi:hypothetical protein
MRDSYVASAVRERLLIFVALALCTAVQHLVTLPYRRSR